MCNMPRRNSGRPFIDWSLSRIEQICSQTRTFSAFDGSAHTILSISRQFSSFLSCAASRRSSSSTLFIGLHRKPRQQSRETLDLPLESVEAYSSNRVYQHRVLESPGRSGYRTSAVPGLYLSGKRVYQELSRDCRDGAGGRGGHRLHRHSGGDDPSLACLHKKQAGVHNAPARQRRVNSHLHYAGIVYFTV